MKNAKKQNYSIPFPMRINKRQHAILTQVKNKFGISKAEVMRMITFKYMSKMFPLDK
jgi:hypothetical protein